MRRAAVGILILLILTTACPAVAQPSAEGIIASVKRTFDAVRDYRADISLTIRGPRISVRNMRMTIYCKRPNKFHIDATEGMAVIPPGNYFGNPIMDLMRATRPVYLRYELKCGRDCHMLRLDPAPGGVKPQVSVWVDKERGVIVATSFTGQGATTTEWRYEKVDGRYWLPVEMKAESRMPGTSGKSHAVVKFSNYRVNKGISDRIFEEKARKQVGPRR